MDLDDFKVASQPKCIGTSNLVDVFDGQPLDFFLMLSSATSILGMISQGNYAAGNNYMDTLAQNKSISENSTTHFVSIDFGPIYDVGFVASKQQTKEGLLRWGFVLLGLKELLALVGYAISHSAKKAKTSQIVLGFDHKSITQGNNTDALNNPMLAHLFRLQGRQSVKGNETTIQSIQDLVADAKDIAEIELIMSKEIARKISNLVTMDYDDIDLDRSITEFALDSLVTIELKNWITKTFQAKLQTLEISDVAHISALAGVVASRSAFVSKGSQNRNPENEQSTNSKKNGTVVVEPKSEDVVLSLPKQPLPDLDNSLDQLLISLLPILTPTEYARYEGYVNEFRQPGGFGRKLQARLSQLAHNPKVDNWLNEFYAANMYLKKREPLVPWYNFFAAHVFSPIPHTAAERAAIISISAFQFKKKLEAGEVGQESLNEQPVSKDHASKWFFNSTREPGNTQDTMKQYPGNDYLVAFRRGHAYKISLRNGNDDISFPALRDTFQGILDADKMPESWVGVLTQDRRDRWANVSLSLSSLTLN